MAEADPRTTFNVHDAKTNLSQLLDRAHAGEEIVIAKAGEPWARLVAIEPPPPLPKRKPGGLKVTGPVPDSVWFDPLSENELELWEGKRLEKYGL